MNTPTAAGSGLPRPFCAACGHDLTGATAASACPECGRPLVEVLTRDRRNGGLSGKPTRRYTSERRVFGLPLLSIALGPDGSGRMGHAKGYIAIGDIATGVFAFGGVSRGLVAFGGISVGGVTFGGLSVGTFAAFGGGAVAWLGSAVGGMAVGLLAGGGGAFGLLAQGGLAVGWLARGADAKGVHIWSQRVPPDDATRALFDQYAWLVGPAGGGPQIHYHLAWTAAVAVAIAAIALIPIALARPRRDRIAEELAR